jgi:hypothetical protein
MTPQEALHEVAKALQDLPLPMAGHVHFQRCVNVLNAAIQPKVETVSEVSEGSE